MKNMYLEEFENSRTADEMMKAEYPDLMHC